MCKWGVRVAKSEKQKLKLLYLKDILMEKNKYMDGRMGHGGRVCGIRGADSVCGDQLCEQCQHYAGCDTDGGGIPAGSRCGIQF